MVESMLKVSCIKHYSSCALMFACQCHITHKPAYLKTLNKHILDKQCFVPFSRMTVPVWQKVTSPYSVNKILTCVYKYDESEEEYFNDCSVDANVTAAQGLRVIQKMLDMVRVECDDFAEDKYTNKIVVSKLNSQNSEFKFCKGNTSTPTGQSPNKQIKEIKKRLRNIAIESILQSIEDNKIQSKEIILRKPNEFIAKVEAHEIKQSEILKSKEVKFADDSCNNNSATTRVEKVNRWLDTLTGRNFPKKTSKATLEATSIFLKKHKKVKKVNECPKILKRQEMNLSWSSNSVEYKPSLLSYKYYKKYVERIKSMESVRENIWAKAEQKMKKIDMRKRRKAMKQLTSLSSESSGHNQSYEETQITDATTETLSVIASSKKNRCLELIGLSQHRHSLTLDCVVCEVVNKPRDLKYEHTDAGEKDSESDTTTTEDSSSGVEDSDTSEYEQLVNSGV